MGIGRRFRWLIKVLSAIFIAPVKIQLRSETQNHETVLN